MREQPVHAAASERASFDVFISYSRQDHDRVKPLADLLIGRGWRVWWDRDIQPGQQFRQEIEEALANSTCIVVVWSQNSVQSKWVVDEAAEGRDRGVLVPVLIDNIAMPLSFRGYQAVDLVDWSGEEDHAGFESLASAVGTLVETQRQQNSSAVGESSSAIDDISRRNSRKSSATPGRRQIWLVFLVGFFLLCAMAFFWFPVDPASNTEKSPNKSVPSPALSEPVWRSDVSIYVDNPVDLCGYKSFTVSVLASSTTDVLVRSKDRTVPDQSLSGLGKRIALDRLEEMFPGCSVLITVLDKSNTPRIRIREKENVH